MSKVALCMEIHTEGEEPYGCRLSFEVKEGVTLEQVQSKISPDYLGKQFFPWLGGTDTKISYISEEEFEEKYGDEAEEVTGC